MNEKTPGFNFYGKNLMEQFVAEKPFDGWGVLVALPLSIWTCSILFPGISGSILAWKRLPGSVIRRNASKKKLK
jgi:hypothetical protein